jgi:hypothetical protein
MASKKSPMRKPPMRDFTGAFMGLRKILRPYAANLRAKDDTSDSYYLETRTSDPRTKPLFFAAAKINKNYVSFHLMAAYSFPELLKGMSPELKKHMQGKACFNFSAPDAALFSELDALTAAGASKFRSQKEA